MSLSRLDKILVSQNVGTRKEVQELIKKGNVKIDNTIQKKYDIKIDPEINTIKVCGEILNFRRYMYIMMNKPSGVISASNDLRQKTVIDLVPKELYRRKLFPAGRLDIDTEGLIILTDDGIFSHKMLSPVKKVYKLYEAYIDNVISQDNIIQFKEGIVFNTGEKCLPAELKLLKQDGKNSLVEIKICEGKFHQVKKMFLSIGMKVLHLKRTQIGSLRLDKSLKPGECRELTPQELELIFE